MPTIVILSEITAKQVDLETLSKEELIRLTAQYMRYQDVVRVVHDLFPRENLIAKLKQRIELANKFEKGEW